MVLEVWMMEMGILVNEVKMRVLVEGVLRVEVKDVGN